MKSEAITLVRRPCGDPLDPDRGNFVFRNAGHGIVSANRQSIGRAFAAPVIGDEDRVGSDRRDDACGELHVSAPARHAHGLPHDSPARRLRADAPRRDVARAGAGARGVGTASPPGDPRRPRQVRRATNGRAARFANATRHLQPSDASYPTTLKQISPVLSHHELAQLVRPQPTRWPTNAPQRRVA